MDDYLSLEESIYYLYGRKIVYKNNKKDYKNKKDYEKIEYLNYCYKNHNLNYFYKNHNINYNKIKELLINLFSN